MKAFYQMTCDEVLEQLGAGKEGLSNAEVVRRLSAYGPNLIPEAKQRSRWSILLAQFRDLMIIILLIAAGVSFFVGESTDALVILAIIVANAWMGYSQEYDAEQSIRMLRKMAAPYAL